MKKIFAFLIALCVGCTNVFAMKRSNIGMSFGKVKKPVESKKYSVEDENEKQRCLQISFLIYLICSLGYEVSVFRPVKDISDDGFCLAFVPGEITDKNGYSIDIGTILKEEMNKISYAFSSGCASKSNFEKMVREIIINNALVSFLEMVKCDSISKVDERLNSFHPRYRFYFDNFGKNFIFKYIARFNDIVSKKTYDYKDVLQIGQKAMESICRKFLSVSSIASVLNFRNEDFLECSSIFESKSASGLVDILENVLKYDYQSPRYNPIPNVSDLEAELKKKSLTAFPKGVYSSLAAKSESESRVFSSSSDHFESRIEKLKTEAKENTLSLLPSYLGIVNSEPTLEEVKYNSVSPLGFPSAGDEKPTEVSGNTLLPLPPFPIEDSSYGTTFVSSNDDVFPFNTLVFPYACGSTYQINLAFPYFNNYASGCNVSSLDKECASFETERSDGLPPILK